MHGNRTSPCWSERDCNRVTGQSTDVGVLRTWRAMCPELTGRDQGQWEADDVPARRDVEQSGGRVRVRLVEGVSHESESESEETAV